MLMSSDQRHRYSFIRIRIDESAAVLIFISSSSYPTGTHSSLDTTLVCYPPYKITGGVARAGANVNCRLVEYVEIVPHDYYRIEIAR